MLSKRGQGLSTNAIILIVLGVIVLVVLVIGFTMGWDKIAPWISDSGNNADTVVQQCKVACTTSSVNSFCTQERNVKVKGDVVETKSCYEFARANQYGIESCPAIDCVTVLSGSTTPITQKQTTEFRDACQGDPKTSWSVNTRPKEKICKAYTFSKSTYYCCEI